MKYEVILTKVEHRSFKTTINAKDQQEAEKKAHEIMNTEAFETGYYFDEYQLVQWIEKIKEEKTAPF